MFYGLGAAMVLVARGECLKLACSDSGEEKVFGIVPHGVLLVEWELRVGERFYIPAESDEVGIGPVYASVVFYWFEPEMPSQNDFRFIEVGGHAYGFFGFG